MDNNKYVQAIEFIQEEQSKIIGEEISKMILNNVSGLEFNNGTPEIVGDPKSILDALVTQYATLFGQASIMISKQAIKHVSPSFSTNELPDNLR